MSNVVELKTARPPALTNKKDIPDFITRVDIAQMPDDQLDEMLTAIRDRRMHSYAIYKQTQDQREEIEQERVKERIEKKCTQIIKKMNLLDKHTDDLEKFINELRGLRIQAGLEII